MAEPEPWTAGLSIKNAKICLRAKGVNPDGIVEKKELLQLLSDNVADLDEAVALIKSGSSTAAKTGQPTPAAQSEDQATAVSGALAKLKSLPKQQLTYQAAVIKRDPGYARRQNPALAGATDEQMLACAKEMEERAEAMTSNPREAERMEDEAQVDSMLDMIINRPEEFKKGLSANPMLATMVTDAQLTELRGMTMDNKAWLRWAFIKMAKLRRLYEALNVKTGGKAKYIVGVAAVVVVAVVCYFVWLLVGWLFRNTVGRLWGSSSGGDNTANFPTEPLPDGGDVDGAFFGDTLSSTKAPESVSPAAASAGAGTTGVGVNIAGEDDEFGDFVDPAASN